jgi:hypothetical protein
MSRKTVLLRKAATLAFSNQCNIGIEDPKTLLDDHYLFSSLPSCLLVRKLFGPGHLARLGVISGDACGSAEHADRNLLGDTGNETDHYFAGFCNFADHRGG